jgi:prepilin-type processing-associated H-X9-DG protein
MCRPKGSAVCAGPAPKPQASLIVRQSAAPWRMPVQRKWRHLSRHPGRPFSRALHRLSVGVALPMESSSYGYNGWETVSGAPTSLGLAGNWPDLTGFLPVPVSPDPTVKEGSVVHPCDMIAMGDANLICFIAQVGRDPYPDGGSTVGNGCFSPLLAPDMMWLLGTNPSLSTNGLNPNVYVEINLTQRRHGGRFNTLFCDGHVETLAAQKLFDYRQGQVIRRWLRDNQPHTVP